MPIIDLDEGFNLIDDSPEGGAENQEEKETEEIGVSLLYNKETPLTNIVKHITGYKWPVTYFNQLRDINDTLTQFDITSSSTIQKYTKIKNLVLYVQTTLGLDKAESLSGEAIVRGDFLPNAHDLFLARLPGGRLGLFTIVDVEDKTSNLNKIYSITYSILHFIDEKYSPILKSLNHKVMKTYVYDHEHLSTTSSPLVAEESYKRKINLEDSYKEMVEYYLDNFLNKKGILSIPSLDGKIYLDPFLTDFLLKTTDTSNFIKFSYLNRPPIDKFLPKPFTILDLIIEKNLNNLKRSISDMRYRVNKVDYTHGKAYITHNKMGIHYIMGPYDANSAHYFVTKPLLKDISTLNKYKNENEVHPNVSNKLINSEFSRGSTITNVDISIENKKISIDSNYYGREKSEFHLAVSGTNREKYREPLGYEDDFYIFSNYFYKEDIEKCGLIEKLIFSYLEDKILDPMDITTICNQYHMWSTIDQFNLIPISLFLIKYYIYTIDRT